MLLCYIHQNFNNLTQEASLNSSIHILYCGQLWNGSTALHRLRALESIENVNCDALDSTPQTNNFFISQLMRISIKFKFYFDFFKVGKRLEKMARRNNYDVIWIDKGLEISSSNIINIKKTSRAKIVFFSPDDMYNFANQSYKYLKCLPYFDFNITTKSYNTVELSTIGARNIIFMNKSYSDDLHRPLNLTDEDLSIYSTDVGFIGSFEEDRFQKMLFLAQNGIKVTIRGESWKKFINYHKNLLIIPKNEWEENYVKVLNATKINLCFLKKANRDLQTARSIEIPACGGFMLAERTREHMSLFEDGKEAVFFDNSEDLLVKVLFYLNHEQERKEISNEGHKRCISSGYSHKNTLSNVLSKILLK